MGTVEDVPPLEGRKTHTWCHYLIDSILACAGALLVTAVIFTFHLYPRIPNISIVYLLVVIGLASTRGRYAAILASIVAFLSFDFFLVPPLIYLCHRSLGGMDCTVCFPRDGPDHEPAYHTDAAKCRASQITRA